MAKTQIYVLGGDHQSSLQLLWAAIAEQGFEVVEQPGGQFLLQKGSKGRSIGLGALAGGSFYVEARAHLSTSPEGNLVVQLISGAGMGALMGGVIGAARVRKAQQALAENVSAALAQSGRLLSHQEA